MSDYIPPQQIQIQTITNFARPDGRDRIETTAQYLGEGLKVSAFHGFYANPDIERSNISIEFKLSDDTAATVGGELVDGEFIPEVAFTSVLIDEANQRLMLYAETSLNDSDARAIAERIRRYVVGASVKFGDVSNKAQVTFNTDGVQVYENWLSIPLTDDGLLTLNSYTRAASDESAFYWSPNTFATAGILAGLPVEFSDSSACKFGAQPGFALNAGSFELGAQVGGRCQYNSPNFSLNSSLSYGYGFTGQVTARWTL